MLAYFGNPAIKDYYINRVTAHEQADEILQGYGYWRNGRGCAVGCSIHGDRHSDYEKELGIPVELAFCEDTIFENLPGDRARSWPREFLAAPAVGADLSLVWPQFVDWLLSDAEHGMAAIAVSDSRVQQIVGEIADLHRRWAASGIRDARLLREASEIARDRAWATLHNAAEYAAMCAARCADDRVDNALYHAIFGRGYFGEYEDPGLREQWPFDQAERHKAGEQRFVLAAAGKLLALMAAAPVRMGTPVTAGESAAAVI